MENKNFSNKLKMVYRYWLSKADNRIHKDTAYIEYKQVDGKEMYVIFDSNYKTLGDMKKEEFNKDMLKRSAGQAIYFYKENDELAYKHFEWAINEKIKSAQEQLDKYNDIMTNISMFDEVVQDY